MAEMKNKGYDVSSVKLDVNSCDYATFFQEGMGTFYEMREGLKKIKMEKTCKEIWKFVEPRVTLKCCS